MRYRCSVMLKYIPMADIQFQETQYAQHASLSGPTGIIGLVMRWGLASDERQAKLMLLIITIAAAVAAVFIYGPFAGTSQTEPIYKEGQSVLVPPLR